MRAQWLLVILVLACTGCELGLEVEVVFDRGGGGRLAVAVAADAELLDRAGAAGADPLGDLAATGEALGGGWRVADTTDDDGGRTVTLSAGFGDDEEFDRLAGELADSLAAAEVELLGPLSARREGDLLVVEGTAGVQPTEAVADYGLTPDEAVALLRDEGAFTYHVRLALPGEVLDTTAEQRDEGVLAWTVPPGEQVAIRAVGEWTDRPVWPFAVGVGGLLLGALLVARALVMGRR